jgi:hypothetical protein
MSVDPLTASYPWYTPYQFAGNKPITFIDIDGLEEGLPKMPGEPARDNMTAIDASRAPNFAILDFRPPAPEVKTYEPSLNIFHMLRNQPTLTGFGMTFGVKRGSLATETLYHTANDVNIFFKLPFYGRGEGMRSLDGSYMRKGSDEATLAGIGGLLTISPFFLETSGGKAITMYRGVNSSAGKAYRNALKGIVKPRGGIFGHSNALKHNTGINGTLNSKLTSWTTNKDVALNYAFRKNGSGVLLEKQVSVSKLIDSPNLKRVNLFHKPGTVVSESEFLLKGPLNNMNMTKVKLK